MQWFVYCPNRHRTVVLDMPFEYDDNAFLDTPYDPPGSAWPETCPECSLSIERSRMGYRMYRRPETGEEKRKVWEFGIGAMFDASWLPWKGPDGLSLSVVLPPGGQNDVWHIDGPAGGTDRRPWTRTGVPPLVTASPSILTPRYHGHLQNGILTDSLGDRPLPAPMV